eukprot:scaffold1830_cov246-Pinguiococcus_pyrenoidosus.AAC.12
MLRLRGCFSGLQPRLQGRVGNHGRGHVHDCGTRQAHVPLPSFSQVVPEQCNRRGGCRRRILAFAIAIGIAFLPKPPRYGSTTHSQIAKDDCELTHVEQATLQLKIAKPRHDDLQDRRPIRTPSRIGGFAFLASCLGDAPIPTKDGGT